jgi:hypothetical protein
MTDIHSCSYYCDRPACIKAQRDELRDKMAQPEQEPLHPVHIGVDVTQEGTTVTAFYRKPDAVMEMFYSQFHPMAQPEQEPVACIEYIPCCTDQTCPKCRAATPPQRKPLTDEEMLCFDALGSVEYVVFIRSSKPSTAFATRKKTWDTMVDMHKDRFGDDWETTMDCTLVGQHLTETQAEILAALMEKSSANPSR